MLKLIDLTENQRIVLSALHKLRTAHRSTIAAAAGLDRNRVSSFLNRLESFGLVDKSENATWTMTAAGDALYGPTAASPDPDDADSGPVAALESAATRVEPELDDRAETILIDAAPDPSRIAILEELSRFPRSRWPDSSFDVWVLEQVATRIYPDMPVAAARLRVIAEKIGACA